MFRCGQYVRNTKKDLGTGQVVRIQTTEWLFHDGTIRNDVVFGVKWLDLQPPTLQQCAAEELAPAVRSVPTFNSIEEADAWMEAQASGGSWVGAADDLNATVAEVIDSEAHQLVAEAERSLTVRCGGEECGCLDCTRMGEEHCASYACGCLAKDCGCTH